MNNIRKNICVFCSSSSEVPSDYKKLAYNFGMWLAQNGYTLVYGGGQVGLMGEIGKAIRSYNGKKIGIIPKRLVTREIAATDDDKQIVTQTMSQRKEILVRISDIFIAFPGGFGTLDELLEVITLRQLGYHHKPIYIFNYNSFLMVC